VILYIGLIRLGLVKGTKKSSNLDSNEGFERRLFLKEQNKRDY